MDGWGEVAALLMMGNTSTYNISYNYPLRIQTISVGDAAERLSAAPDQK